jgi:putative NADPH-quinone reductase
MRATLTSDELVSARKCKPTSAHQMIKSYQLLALSSNIISFHFFAQWRNVPTRLKLFLDELATGVDFI